MTDEPRKKHQTDLRSGEHPPTGLASMVFAPRTFYDPEAERQRIEQAIEAEHGQSVTEAAVAEALGEGKPEK